MTELKNIQQQKRFKILLIGDSCRDEYFYGVVERLNPEAPVPILKITRSETKDGMAANVKNNLSAFGCDVTFLHSDAVSIKRRYIDERSKQHIVRVDSDLISDSCDISSILNFESYDAIVVSDYNKGFVSYETIEQLKKRFFGPIFIDTKKQDIARFDGCFVKINESEYKQRHSICSTMIVTLGGNGAMYRQHGKEVFFPGVPVEVVDVCGAGDTFLAALVFKYLISGCIEQAIPFANKCAAISVQNQGVYCLTSQDISGIIFSD